MKIYKLLVRSWGVALACDYYPCFETAKAAFMEESAKRKYEVILEEWLTSSDKMKFIRKKEIAKANINGIALYGYSKRGHNAEIYDNFTVEYFNGAYYKYKEFANIDDAKKFLEDMGYTLKWTSFCHIGAIESVPISVSSETIEIVKANTISTFRELGYEYDDETISKIVAEFVIRQSEIIHAFNEFKQSMV